MDFTKGEWKVDGTDVRSRYPFVILADGVVIARIEDEGNSGTPEANASLISTAPEMYRALKVISSVSFDGDAKVIATPSFRELLEKILAKAEGKK